LKDSFGESEDGNRDDPPGGLDFPDDLRLASSCWRKTCILRLNWSGVFELGLDTEDDEEERRSPFVLGLGYGMQVRMEPPGWCVILGESTIPEDSDGVSLSEPLDLSFPTDPWFIDKLPSLFSSLSSNWLYNSLT